MSKKLAIVTHEYSLILSVASFFADKLCQSLSKMDYRVQYF